MYQPGQQADASMGAPMMPGMQGQPQMGGPPQMMDPQMGGQQMGGPPLGADGFGIGQPPMGGPPQANEPPMGGQMMDPQMGGQPQMMDPQMGGQPMMMDPQMGGQPMMMDPQLGGQPMMMDPQMMQPMGGPPQMMGPPMGQPMMGGTFDPVADAEAKLAELEEKQRKAREKEKKEDIDYLTKQIRSGRRHDDESSSCSKIIVLWGIMNALLWAGPLLGDAWWFKKFSAAGVDELGITFGLFNMKVSTACTGRGMMGLDNEAYCKAFEPYSTHDNGQWAIAEMKDKMCKDLPEACPIMKRMYFSALGPVVGLPIAAGFEMLGVFAIFCYWSVMTSSGCMRKTGNQLACLAPTVGMLGIVFWLVVCPFLQELPRLWAKASITEAVPGKGITETFTIPGGWCFHMAMFAVVSSTLKAFVQITSLGQHTDEDDGYDEETEALRREAMRSYNAVDRAA